MYTQSGVSLRYKRAAEFLISLQLSYTFARSLLCSRPWQRGLWKW